MFTQMLRVGITGLVFTDIDDARNRLNIGVMTDEVQALVEEQLGRLGIPREAFIIEKSSPFEFDSSLQDRHRPLVGGLLVSFFDLMGKVFDCTLGFNAIRAGVPGFVTVSHCTADPGGVEGTVFYQPSSPDSIGVETEDPRYKVTHADDPNCRVNPDGTTRNCRYSDSAFARRDIGVEADRGFIAQPPLNIGQPDPTAWNEVDSFRIVDANPTISVGDHVNKVGIATG